VKRFFAHRVVAATAIVVAGCLMACGCSVVSPEASSWDGGYGQVTGTVTDRSGNPLEDITVEMWGEVGASQTETTYEVSTDANGCFEIDQVDLGSIHAFEATYEIYVNCMKDDRAAVNDEYTTYVGTVMVEKSEQCVVTVEIRMADNGPGEPSSTFE